MGIGKTSEIGRDSEVVEKNGVVGVGKRCRRKSSPEKFAGGECFLTTIRLTGKYWEMGKVTGMKHGHRKVSRS